VLLAMMCSFSVQRLWLRRRTSTFHVCKPPCGKTFRLPRRTRGQGRVAPTREKSGPSAKLCWSPDSACETDRNQMNALQWRRQAAQEQGSEKQYQGNFSVFLCQSGYPSSAMLRSYWPLTLARLAVQCGAAQGFRHQLGDLGALREESVDGGVR
jgi:hypothetical protein